MKTIEQVLSQITQEAEAHTTEERFIRTADIGQVARQGDIYLRRVPDNHRRGDEIQDRQLAPGTTKGSRHVVEAGEHVTLYAPQDSMDPLAGPVIVARERFRVTHPEHADFSLPSGTWEVGYQLDARTRRRVAD